MFEFINSRYYEWTTSTFIFYETGFWNTAYLIIPPMSAAFVYLYVKSCNPNENDATIASFQVAWSCNPRHETPLKLPKAQIYPLPISALLELK